MLEDHGRRATAAPPKATEAETCDDGGPGRIIMHSEHPPLIDPTGGDPASPWAPPRASARHLPCVDHLLRSRAGAALVAEHGHTPAWHMGHGRALDELATALRPLRRPVIGRAADDRLLPDLRFVEDALPSRRQLVPLHATLRR